MRSAADGPRLPPPRPGRWGPAALLLLLVLVRPLSGRTGGDGGRIGAASPRPDTLPEAPALRASGQHLVSVVQDPGATTGTLYRLEAGDDGWHRVGPPIPVVVGRSGVGPKREGDGRSPRGVFRLGPAFGYAPEPPEGLSLSYRPMAPGAVCVDDPASAHYARIVDRGEVDRPDWSSAEAMRRDLVHGDGLYELGLVVRYNPARRPGAGSCIFLHVWRGPGSPTAGCTAMPEGRLRDLLTWLRPERSPLLVQGTRAHLEELRRRGALPYPVPGPVDR